MAAHGKKKRPRITPAEFYDRQPNETDPAWEAFVTYRDMEKPRSIRRAAMEIAGKSDWKRWADWSSKHRWTERAAAWDNRVDQAKREGHLSAAIELGKRHGDEAREIQHVLMEPVRELQKRIQARIQKGEEPFAEYTFKELVRLTVEISRAFVNLGQFERLARGLSTTNVGGHDGGPLVDWSGKPREEVEAYLLGFNDGTGQLMKDLEAGRN